MKKCPYCAEEIKDEALVCRYCGRDLVPNVDQFVNSESQSGNKLSMSDIFSVAKEYPESFDVAHSIQQIVKFTGGLNKEVLGPIFDNYTDHKLKAEVTLKKKMESIAEGATLWGLVCCGIGIEKGNNNITATEADDYLIAITLPCPEFLLISMSNLFENLFSEEEINSEYARVLNVAHQTASKIEDFGIRECKFVVRKNSNFLTALKNIKHLK